MFFFYRHCLLISGENVKRFWILVRVLVSNKCWRHAEHIVVSSACRQKFVLDWSFSPRWLFVQRVASRVALSEDINTISAQHAPDKLWVSKIFILSLILFYDMDYCKGYWIFDGPKDKYLWKPTNEYILFEINYIVSA